MRIELKDDSIVIATDPKTERDLAPQILAFCLGYFGIEEVEEVEEVETPAPRKWTTYKSTPIDPISFSEWLVETPHQTVVECLNEYCGGPVHQCTSAFSLSKELPQSCKRLGMDRWVTLVEFMQDQDVYTGSPKASSLRSYYNTALRSLGQ